MLKIYGSMLCPDCVQCRQALDDAGVAYEYLDLADNLKNLKEFLKLRDENALFDSVKREGKIGIPCILMEDGVMLLRWEELM